MPLRRLQGSRDRRETPPPGRPLMGSFGVCVCGHPIYEHGRVNKDGNQVWVACRILDCGCLLFRASDGSLWPETRVGATVDDPDDLDRNTVAWVGGRVVLERERPAARLADAIARARRAQGRG